MFARRDVVANSGFSATGPKAISSGVTYGPASILLLPAATCASQSLVNGAGISLATAGTAAGFSVTSRDEYGNDRAVNEDMWSVIVDGPARLHFTVYPDTRSLSSNTYAAASYPSLTGRGRYSIQYTLTAAGNYQVSVFRNLKSGLIVEVYGNSGLRMSPVFTGLDASVDYDWGTGAIAPASAENPTEFASDFVSVRWTGFVLLDVAETVTFSVDTAPSPAGIDGARLWVEGLLMIDTLSASGNISGTFQASAAASLYSIMLEFRATTGKNNFRPGLCAQ